MKHIHIFENFNNKIKKINNILNGIPNGEYTGSIIGYDVYINGPDINIEFKTTSGYKNRLPIKCIAKIENGLAYVYSKGGILFSSTEAESQWKTKYKNIKEDPMFIKASKLP